MEKLDFIFTTAAVTGGFGCGTVAVGGFGCGTVAVGCFGSSFGGDTRSLVVGGVASVTGRVGAENRAIG